jgi:hypothetical protein
MRYVLLISFLLLTCIRTIGQGNSSETLSIRQTANFVLSGNGANKAWEAAAWNTLTPRDNEERKVTRFKVLYSNTGMYFLFHNEDEILTASKTADFEKLWLEDVIEVFLWTDTTETTYFEYEISPLNYELPILIPNFDGKFLGWRPWQYEGERKIKHLTHIEGGEKKTGSKIKAWYSEFFIPFALLAPLRNVPPQKGTVWKANMYRIDYDNKDKIVRWLWRRTETNFHQFTKFGKVIFD